MARLAPVSGRSSHSSINNSSSGFPDTVRSGRLRVHARALWNVVESKSQHKPQTLVQYENTYRMEPSDNWQFSATRVKQVIGDVFEHYLRDQPYDPKVFPNLIKTLTEAIKDGVKTQHLNRFKTITTVTVIQKNDQGIQISSLALCDPISDSYASLTYERPSYFVVGVVYAVYQE